MLKRAMYSLNSTMKEFVAIKHKFETLALSTKKKKLINQKVPNQ